MLLTRLAITRPVTILMLILALVILGLQSRSRLPVDLYPPVDLPMLFVSTIYTGTGPEEMETLVTKPIEDAISSVSGLNKLTSTSSEGISSIRMEFEIGTNIDQVSSDVRAKIDAIRNTLPQDSKAPVVIKLDLGAIPVLSLSVSSSRRSAKDIRLIADDLIKDRLSQVAGVAAVAVSGGDIREIRVEVDKSRLEAYGLSITQVVDALQAENLNFPSGSVEEPRRTSAVRVMGEFTNPAQIKDVRIQNSAGNPNLTIGDVAYVSDTVAKPDEYTRVNAAPSVALSIQKQSNANTVEVVDGVREALEKLTGKPYTEEHIQAQQHGKKWMTSSPLLGSDLDITVAMDQSTFIKDTLHDVYQSLLEGALLAILIVFLFLHSLRGTFIVGLAIPTSMIATFLVMDMLGFTVNMMSMLGLSLSVGILVDDSIVVIENIHRHLAMGTPPREAAIKGRTEIGLAAMTITFVDVVVFVPIAFMGGIVGQMFRQFGLTVAAATLFSLFISFTLTPMLASRWLKPHDLEEEDEARQRANPGLFRRFTNSWEKSYQWLNHGYRRILVWGLDHHPAVIAMGLMTMAASVATMMPKPTLSGSLHGLPVLLVSLLLIAAIWTGVHFLHGWLRWLSAFIAVIVTVGISLSSGKMSGITTPMISMLMLILMLMIMAFSLTKPADRQQTTRTSGVALPLLIWATALFALCIFVPAKFGFEFAPSVDRRQFSITVKQEVGTSLSVTDATVKKIETALYDPGLYPETKTVFSTIGANSASLFGGGGASSDIASMNVELKTIDDLTDIPAFKRFLLGLRLLPSPMRTTDEVVRSLNARFAQEPGVTITAAIASGFGGGGAPIQIIVNGNDTKRIMTVSAQLIDILKHTPGVFGADLSSREGRPELQAHIDRDRAAQYGISVNQIGSALRTSLEGNTDVKYRELGREYDIHVFLPENQRTRLDQMANMVVGTTAGGTPVALSDVTHLEPAVGPTQVERFNRQRSVTVTASLLQGATLGNIKQAVDAKVAGVDLTGVTIFWSGSADEMGKAFKSMFNALFLSIAMVFMLMAALFESLLAPMIIMLSVPQAMAGALFALAIGQKWLSIVTMIGIIMLVGLVTKNAILMVDYTNTLRREEGMNHRDALLRAGPTRLRPILMTTLAMIFGMLPTALALSKGSEMRQPMAISVIGGLLLALFLTLIMVPSFYEIIDDLSQRFTRVKERILSRLGG